MENKLSKKLTLSQIAKKYVGQRETPNNSGFINSEFKYKIVRVGWLIGQAWCSYFAELVAKEYLIQFADLEKWKAIDSNFSGSTTATFKNFDLNKLNLEKINIHFSLKPVSNSIGFFRHGIGWQGHTVVIDEVFNNLNFTSIEGNTNSNGSREGIEVALKHRLLSAKISSTELNFLGCIYFSNIEGA